MTIRPERRAALETAARKILRGKSRYLAVERATGVPWFVIGVLHYRESDCSFLTHLHNGDPLSGRTYHVPAGRPPTGNPPFTWEASAKDALSYEGFASIHDWPIERIGYSCERYNGGGYYGQDVNSPMCGSAPIITARGRRSANIRRTGISIRARWTSSSVVCRSLRS